MKKIITLIATTFLLIGCNSTTSTIPVNNYFCPENTPDINGNIMQETINNYTIINAIDNTGLVYTLEITAIYNSKSKSIKGFQLSDTRIEQFGTINLQYEPTTQEYGQYSIGTYNGTTKYLYISIQYHDNLLTYTLQQNIGLIESTQNSIITID